ncbi:MAG TPA: cytochrome c3 family protein [Bacillota bacterium]|nr:cytochrome c3 family protein [Bacillota bacterium]
MTTNVYGVVYNGGNGYCLVCHGQFGNNLTFSTGYGMSAYWISLAGDHLINPQGFSGMEVQSSVYNAMHYDAREQLLNPASGSAITCVTCHEKHGSENSGLTDETPANSNRPASNNAREKLCFKCHNTTNIGNGKLTPLTAGYDVYARFNTGGYTKHQITNEASYGFTCSSCHGPHSVSGRTFDNSSSSLPSDISDPTNTKNNFNKSMGTMNDFCLKCHNAASGQVLQKITSATALVPYSVYLPVGSTFGYGSGWNKSSYSSSQHNASSVVCTGCHDPHGSAYKGMTAYPEDPSGAPTSTSGACLRCHGGGATPAGPNVYTGGFGAASGGHPTLTRSGLHSNTTESNNANWNQGAGRHSECSDCHDPHRAQGGISTPGANRATVADWSAFGANGGPDSETRVDDVLPSSLTGQWGVNVGLGTFTRGSGTPGTNSFSYNASPTRQYNICFKCHSSYSWNGSGTSTTYTSTPTGTPPATTFPLTTYISAGNAGAGKQPDIAEQFNPGNYAFHPLFRIGLNQPVANLNTNWSTSAGRRFATSTYRGGDGITSIFGVVYNIGNYTVTGLDNTFVEGWGTKSLVTCSDCHASSDTTVDGPHGSAQKYLLRKAEPRTVKIADGTVVNLNTGTQLAAAYAGDTRAVNNFCLNCHRADVYGNGRGDYNGITTSYVTFSRLSHNFRTSSSPSGNCMASGNAAIGTVDQSPSCLGCHGGREPGGIHGTKLVSSGNPGTDPQGKRFANGANWGGHELGTTSMGCYTVGDDAVAACGHGHTGTGTGTNYTY